MEVEFQEVAEVLIAELQAEVAPHTIVVYGSFGEGRQRSDSDVDVAYLGGKKIGDYDRFLLAQRLASTVDRDVDLVDLATASTVLQMQVMNKGKVVYCSDEHERQVFEMLVYKMYARLNEERHEVLLQFEQGVKHGG